MPYSKSFFHRNISYVSSIVPEVKDIWPVFQLYGKIFDECPSIEQLEGLPWAKSILGKQGLYTTEGSVFYFKRKNAKIIGKDMNSIDEACNINNYYINDSFYFSINSYFSNADTDIINAIV